MSAKFSSFFVFYSQVYGSIYSSCGEDIMDGAESICSFPGRSVSDEAVNHRIARILEEMSFCSRGLVGVKDHDFKMYYVRRLYSLSERLMSITGIYAYNAIVETCGMDDMIRNREEVK